MRNRQLRQPQLRLKQHRNAAQLEALAPAVLPAGILSRPKRPWGWGRRLVVAILLAGAEVQATTGSQPAYVEGELLVKFAGRPLSVQAAAANAALMCRTLHSFSACGWQHVRLPAGMSVAQGLTAFQALPNVVAVEPNYRIRLAAIDSATPDDPRFRSQWNLTKIGATNAWALAIGSGEVVVAVIDSGVRYDHEDLASNMWRNPGETGIDSEGRDKATNDVDDDGNGYVDDVYGIDVWNRDSNPDDKDEHGTQVAGIIGAAADNGFGVAGINWRVSIMALKFMENNSASMSQAVECFEYVIRMKRRGVNIRVTNNSWSVYEDANSLALREAMDAASALGILHVCAAGNESRSTDRNPEYPGAYESAMIINVAASDGGDKRTSISNFGRESVDLAAPGSGVITTSPQTTSSYTGFSGTSAASPHVAGAVALLASLDPDLSPAAIKAAILGTVDVLPAWTNLVVSGGRLNVGRAAWELAAPDAPSIILSASPAGGGVFGETAAELTFSRPMDQASVEAAFQVEPETVGAFEWSNLNRTLTFRPAAPWPEDSQVAIAISGAALGADGATLDGNFNRRSDGKGIDDFQWTFTRPPANDAFADAAPITGTEGQVTANNQFATYEVGEPRHGDEFPTRSLWWRWAAPSSGAFSFDTFGSVAHTGLAVYTGTALGDLRGIASADRYNANVRQSRLAFAALAGTTYYVAASSVSWGDDPPVGKLVLNWYPTPPPKVQITPLTMMIGGRVNLTGSGLLGTTRVLFNSVEARFEPKADSPDEFLYAWVPVGATSGPVTVVTPTGSTTTESLFTVRIPDPLPGLTFLVTANAQLTIAWPISAADATLESTEDLSSGQWAPVDGEPVVVKDRFSVSLDLGLGARFFRLRHPSP